MTITLVGSPTLYESDGVTSAVIPIPSGVAVGDLLVATVTHSTNAAIATPSGWSLTFGRASSSGIYTVKLHRFAVSGDVAGGSYTVATSGTAARVTGMMYALRGVDPTTPVDVTPVSVGVNATTAPLVPSMTTVTANTFIDCTASVNSSASETLTAPAPFVELVQNVTGAGRRQAIATRTAPSAGATGTVQWTKTTATSLQHIGMQVAFRADSSVAADPAVPIRVVGNDGRIRTQTTDAASVRIKVATNAAMTTGVVLSSPVTPDSRGNAQHQITGLTAGVTYYYRVMMTSVGGVETADTEPVQGRLPIAPTGATSFGMNIVACCLAADSPVMAAVYNRGDGLLAHQGDLYYNDGGPVTEANYRTQFDNKASKLVAPNHASVMATNVFDYGPSDHDFGFNNDQNAGSTPAAVAPFNLVYRDTFAVGAVGNGTTGIYHTFTWGRVRFIRLDTRSFASAPSATDNSSKSTLGTVQKQWLKDTITAATEPLIIILGDTTWVGPAVAPSDGWVGFTTERAELGAFFLASGKNIGMVTGDTHAVQAHNGTDVTGGVGSEGKIPMWGSAPISNTANQKGGPYSVGPYPASGTASVQQYARLAITDTGTSNITVDYTAYSADNTVRLTQSSTFTTATVTAPTKAPAKRILTPQTRRRDGYLRRS